MSPRSFAPLNSHLQECETFPHTGANKDFAIGPGPVSHPCLHSAISITHGCAETSQARLPFPMSQRDSKASTVHWQKTFNTRPRRGQNWGECELWSDAGNLDLVLLEQRLARLVRLPSENSGKLPHFILGQTPNQPQNRHGHSPQLTPLSLAPQFQREKT